MTRRSCIHRALWTWKLIGKSPYPSRYLPLWQSQAGALSILRHSWPLSLMGLSLPSGSECFKSEEMTTQQKFLRKLNRTTMWSSYTIHRHMRKSVYNTDTYSSEWIMTLFKDISMFVRTCTNAYTHYKVLLVTKEVTLLSVKYMKPKTIMIILSKQVRLGKTGIVHYLSHLGQKIWKYFGIGWGSGKWKQSTRG